MSKGRPRTRIALWDGGRFAKAVGELIDERFDGNITVAAQRIGIERSRLNRLRNGVAQSISVRDLTRLRKALPRKVFAEIERALVTKRVGEALAAFDSWVGAETSRSLNHEIAPNTEVGRAIASVADWHIQRMLEYRHLMSVLRKNFQKLLAGFDKWLERRQHTHSRGELAYLRIVEPLLAFRESGSVERNWEEMSYKELFRFIEAGIKREKVLLNRAPDLQRAQDIAKRDPIDIVILYGDLLDMRAFTGRKTNALIARWITKQLRRR